MYVDPWPSKIYVDIPQTVEMQSVHQAFSLNIPI